MQSNTIRRKMQSVKIFFLQLCNFAVDQGVSRKGKTGFARERASRSQGARQTREARGRHGEARARNEGRASSARPAREARDARSVLSAQQGRGVREARGHASSALPARRGGSTRSESHASSADVTAGNRHVEPKGNLHRQIMPVRCPLLYSKERDATFFRPKRRRFGR